MGFSVYEGRLSSYYGSDEKIVIPKNVRTIQDNTFENKEHIVNIQIPKEVLSIGVGVSYNCPLLLSIDVDSENPHYKSVDGNLYTKDGKTLIQYATGKRDRNFDVPEGVEEISPYAFYGAKHLHSVKLPSSVETIGTSAFYDCTSLANINLPEGVCKIDNYAFRNCAFTDITIPSSVNTVCRGAFSNCKSLQKVIISDDVSAIGEDAFKDCQSLREVTISDGVSAIGENAFCNCTSLSKINIPSSVTAIGKGAFQYCKSLAIYRKELNKPKGWARGWKPFGVKCYLDIKFPLTAVNEEIVPEEEEKDTSLDFKIKGGVLEEYLGNDKIVTVPNDVTEIAVGAFSGKSFIKLIVLEINSV